MHLFPTSRILLPNHGSSPRDFLQRYKCSKQRRTARERSWYRHAPIETDPVTEMTKDQIKSSFFDLAVLEIARIAIKDVNLVANLVILLARFLQVAETMWSVYDPGDSAWDTILSSNTSSWNHLALLFQISRKFNQCKHVKMVTELLSHSSNH